MKGLLYIVGTPIGNLGDISFRAARILSEVDFIAAEDTRVTMKLLNHLEIKKPLVSYYQHNARESGFRIIERIIAGESCALVTDAGMPSISDPGEDLVAECHSKGITVTTVPGPTAFASALALSGMPSGRFCFEGFLSVGRKSRFEHLEELKKERRTMIFYEAPHKLVKTLDDMLKYFGDRKIAIIREITKKHEETILTTLEQGAERYKEEKPRGEIVLIVEGAAKEIEEPPDLEAACNLARQLKDGGMSGSQASKEAAHRTGIKKGDIYRALMEE